MQRAKYLSVAQQPVRQWAALVRAQRLGRKDLAVPGAKHGNELVANLKLATFTQRNAVHRSQVNRIFRCYSAHALSSNACFYGFHRFGELLRVHRLNAFFPWVAES